MTSTIATPDPLTPDNSSFGVTYGALNVTVSNTFVSNSVSKTMNVILSASVSGGHGSQYLTYNWYIVENNTFADLVPVNLGARSGIGRSTAGANTYALFVNNNALTPNPVAYYWISIPNNVVLPANLPNPGIVPSMPKVTDLATLQSANSSNIIVYVKPPKPLPGSIIGYVPITITNNQSTATQAGFQQEVGL